jgi:hypothetical protein
MRRSIYGVLGLGVLFAALLVPGSKKEALAEVNVSVNIGPPPIVVPAPPEVVLVPGAGVFFVPQLDFDVFFYNGYWWSPRGSRWYRARGYNGPWVVVRKRYVPAPVIRVPKDYRHRYERERRIPYGQWKKEHRGRKREDRRERRHGRRSGRG